MQSSVAMQWAIPWLKVMLQHCHCLRLLAMHMLSYILSLLYQVHACNWGNTQLSTGCAQISRCKHRIKHKHSSRAYFNVDTLFMRKALHRQSREHCLYHKSWSHDFKLGGPVRAHSGGPHNKHISVSPGVMKQEPDAWRAWEMPCRTDWTALQWPASTTQIITKAQCWSTQQPCRW